MSTRRSAGAGARREAAADGTAPGLRTDPPPGDAADRGDFIQSLARGLAAIRVFDADHPALTLSDVARRADLSRATARRVLHTLAELGYADSDGRRFRLRPKVLELGFSYLHATGIWGIAQPYMVELVECIHESCSAAVLDGADIVYVARVPTQARIMSISLGLGSRLPAHLTSMGRVLLAALDDTALDARLAALGTIAARTERTQTDPAALRRAIRQARVQGWAVLDQELEPGLRSVAVPIKAAGGRVVAALNVGTQASRVPLDTLRGRILPALQETAAAVSRALGAA